MPREPVYGPENEYNPKMRKEEMPPEKPKRRISGEPYLLYIKRSPLSPYELEGTFNSSMEAIDYYNENFKSAPHKIMSKSDAIREGKAQVERSQRRKEMITKPIKKAGAVISAAGRGVKKVGEFVEEKRTELEDYRIKSAEKAEEHERKKVEWEERQIEKEEQALRRQQLAQKREELRWYKQQQLKAQREAFEAKKQKAYQSHTQIQQQGYSNRYQREQAQKPGPYFQMPNVWAPASQRPSVRGPSSPKFTVNPPSPITMKQPWGLSEKAKIRPVPYNIQRPKSNINPPNIWQRPPVVMQPQKRQVKKIVKKHNHKKRR